jgi:opacity protein-like surface antigen
MHTIRFALVAVLLAAAGNAAAQAPAAFTPSNYLHLRLGAVMPQSSDLDDLKIGTGFDGEIAIGRRFIPNLAGEIGLGYFSAEGSNFSMYDPGSGLTIDLKAKLSGIPITASIKGILPLSPSVELYGLFGLGLYMVTLEATGSAMGQSATTSEDDTAVGVQFGAGVSFDVSSTVFLSADLRYLVAKATFAGAEGKIDSLFLNAGLGFRF